MKHFYSILLYYVDLVVDHSTIASISFFNGIYLNSESRYFSPNYRLLDLATTLTIIFGVLLYIVYCTIQGDVDCVKVLLKYGASVGYEMVDGNTALLAAAHDDKREAAKLLLSAGADPMLPNRDGVTPV